MAKSSEVHNYDDQYENIYNTSKKDKRYRNKKNRKNNIKYINNFFML